MYKGSLLKPAQRKASAATRECSPAQIIKQPRKKKRILRRRIKSQRSRQRTANAQLKVQGRSCSIHAFVSKRIPPQSEEKRLKSCYCGLKTTSIPSKTASSGQSKNSGVTAGERKGKTEHSGKARDFSIAQEHQRRLKMPSPVEKRRYQAVSEYQFIYPGRAVFHCTKESVKQQLRSIYVRNAGQKSLKPTHPSAQIPRCRWELNKAQRRNPNAHAKCPVGSEFQRSRNPNTLPDGLTSLTYKISELTLVNKNRPVAPGNPPSNPAVNQNAPQQQPARSKTPPPAEAFQKLSDCVAKEGGKGESNVDQGGSPNGMRQGASSSMLTASSACFRNSSRPRPVTAKDRYEETLNRAFGEQNPDGETPKSDATEGMPGLNLSSKAAIAQTRSAIIIPTISQCSSSESLNVEGFRIARPSTALFLTEVKEQVPHYVTFGHAGLREKLDGTLSHRPCEKKERAEDSFAVPGSRRYGFSGMDTW